MLIQTLPLTQLNPAKYNPRKITDKAKKGLAKSIEDFGMLQPIIVNKATEGYTVVSGHQRLKVLTEQDCEEIECVIVELSLAKEKKLNILMNSETISGSWDQDMLDAILEEFMSDDDYSDFNLGELESRTAIDKQTTDEDNCDLTLPAEPVTKHGDVYQLGNHRLMCGDSTSVEDVSKLMDGKLADMIFTDPPYSVDYESKSGNSYSKGKYKGEKIFNDNLSEVQAREFYKAVADRLFEFSKENATFYWWYATHKYAWNAEPIIESGWHISQTIIWVKTHFAFSLGQLYHRTYEPCFVGWKKGMAQKKFTHPKLNNLSDVFNLDYDEFLDVFDMWYQKRDNTNSYVHPTQKPISLAERALKRSSRRCELVLDLFGGSGSTMIACEQMGRVNHSMELDPKFCDVIVRRWVNYRKSKNLPTDVKRNGVDFVLESKS